MKLEVQGDLQKGSHIMEKQYMDLNMSAAKESCLFNFHVLSKVPSQSVSHPYSFHDVHNNVIDPFRVTRRTRFEKVE